MEDFLMAVLDNLKSSLGMGCWPIGGAMFATDGTSLGYTNTNDKESIRTIQAAVSNGIELFDTAAAYGAGHSERLLGKALKGETDALIVTKIGMSIDETTKQITGDEIEPETVIPAIDRCLGRLDRDRVDLVLLHVNSLPVEQADQIFNEMDKACEAGKIRAYGWSTDFSGNASAMSKRSNFTAVEHAMNVLTDAPKIQKVVHSNQWQALIRSPLAMGILSGKYSNGQRMPADDIRSQSLQWMQYYSNSQPNPQYLDRFDNIRELLQTGGRTPAQGALAWLWGKSPQNIPIPGARTVEQIEGLAAAVALGPLPDQVMDDIESLVEREKDWSEDMER